MKVGTIFIWEKFEHSQFGGPTKLRYFIYLGETGFPEDPPRAYIHTTTTQRPRGPSFFFNSAKYKSFQEDCWLNYDESPYTPIKSELIGNSDIKIIGTLSVDNLRRLYEGIRTSRNYSNFAKLEIHTSFNMDGITGLKKP